MYIVDTTKPAFTGTSASYKGDAVGMSVVQTFDSKGKELSRASDHFDADVSLTMRFGSSPTLEGTVSNFRGDAVDPSWSVDLGTSVLADGVLGAGEGSNGITDGGGTTTGSWTATAWGGAQARPTGVYGAFDADFTNGAAVGVYSTRKQ